MSEVLKVARYPATVVLTLNRPECRNALARDLVAALTAALRAAECDEDTRSVIMTGAPPAFCAGLDLREMAETTGKQSEQDAAALLTLYETIDRLPKPVIAAVNGPAVAGGAVLVSVCDLVICAHSGLIGYPQIKHGLVATVVLTCLRRLVGERQAKYLLLTGESLTAERALAFGLCNEVVPDDKLLPRARYYAGLFAAHPPQALASTKRLFRELRQPARADVAEGLGGASASQQLTRELREGMGESRA